MRSLPALLLAALSLALLIPSTSAARKSKKKAEPTVAYRADQTPGTELQVAVGEAAFTMCANCHGEAGEGNVGLAPKLASQTWLSIVSNEYIRNTVKNGRPGTNMVPWYGGLGEAALDGVVAYLRSWQTEAGVELNEAELVGDAETGKRRFVDLCAKCHGQRGAGYAAGVDGIGIGRKAFLDSASNGFLRAMIRVGKSGTEMESFTEQATITSDRLSDEDIDSIIRFLRENEW